MDFELIERLMRMLEQSSLNELDVTEKGMRIRLAKQRGTTAGEPPAVESPVADASVESAPASDEAVVIAGMAGAFYRAPAPGAAPFVVVGSTVREGDQLAVIEAMKMFNPVEADRAGVIREILIEDGGAVEPGIALFRIGSA